MASLSLPEGSDPKDRRRIDEATGKRYCLTSIYSDENTLQDLIYYVMQPYDPDTGEEGEELIGFGAIGAPNYASVEEIVDCFQYVQNVNKINLRGGRRAFHEILSFSNTEMKQYEISHDDLINLGYICGHIYYELGFQVLFAAHWNQEEGYHIHFVGNSISYMNGAKWRYDPDNLQSREAYFNALINDYLNRGRFVS